MTTSTSTSTKTAAVTLPTMKTWTRDEIDALLDTSEKAVMRAMVVLYDLQTADEKADSDTRHLNCRGFSAAHAKRGSYIARLILGKRNLWPETLEEARRIAKRHSRQLVAAANAKIQATVTTLAPVAPAQAA